MIGTGFMSQGVSKFADPFLLYSNELMPEDLTTALQWCRHLYTLNPQFREANRRVFSHYITDIDVEGTDAALRTSVRKRLVDALKMLVIFRETGDEYGCYGNAFFRIHFPFTRMLVLPNGKFIELDSYSPDDVQFDLQKFKYEIPNPASSKRKSKLWVPFYDVPDKTEERLSVRKVDPTFMYIEPAPASGRKRFVMRFDPRDVTAVKQGYVSVINDMSIPWLLAIKNNEDFRFNDDFIFHFAEPSISGISRSGWGTPPTLTNYRNIYMCQVLRKINEAVGLDYLVPFRLFSPSTGGDVNESIQRMILGGWKQHISQIVADRRRDMTAIHAVPFPVNYQEHGASGKALAPFDLMEATTNMLLDGMGFPSELFHGTLNYNQAPLAMRLFEANFMFIHHGLQALLQWVNRRVHSYLALPVPAVFLRRPRIADDLNRQQLIVQLAAAGEISRATAYESFGVSDPVGEIDARMAEDMRIQRKKDKRQADFAREQQAMTNGGVDAGGQSVGGGVTPATNVDKAQELAEYWLSIPSDGQRSQEMQKVQAVDHVQYALAKDIMEKIRAQGASQGRQAANQGQPLG